MDEPETKKAKMEDAQLPQSSQVSSNAVSRVFEPKEGEKVEDYTLEKQIARGGFGAVWSGRGPNDKAVAIKILTVEKGAKEAEMMRDLKNKFIVEFITIYTYENYSLLVFEKCERNLDHYLLLEDTIDNGKIHQIMQQISNGIQYLKGKCVVHFDLTPRNVMFKTSELNGGIKIIDFGESFRLAKGAPTKELAWSGLAAAWAFMPPEVFRRDGNPLVGYMTDIWSLGAILYQCSFRKKFCLENKPGLVGSELFALFGKNKETTKHPIEDQPDYDKLDPSQKEMLLGCLAYEHEDRITIEGVMQLLLAKGWAGTVMIINPENFYVPDGRSFGSSETDA